jgi:hypothetical protein
MITAVIVLGFLTVLVATDAGPNDPPVSTGDNSGL